jgi:isoleucyl-tRNA synthetase
VLIVSGVTLVAGSGELRITAASSTDTKCERCWHWCSDVGSNAQYKSLCGRCVSNLFGTGETRTTA